MKRFSARETEWLQELDGIELAPFWRRAIAFVVDWILVSLLLMIVAAAGVFGYLEVRKMHGHPMPASTNFDMRPEHFRLESSDATVVAEVNNEFVHILLDIAVPVLYFGILTWKGKGRSPGKRLTKIRVVSVMHRHLSLWHSIERALGYGAAALELGFGFIQFFIHPYRRCAQDRLAETIVVTERSYRELQRRSQHPLVPDADDLSETHATDELLSSETES